MLFITDTRGLEYNPAHTASQTSLGRVESTKKKKKIEKKNNNKQIPTQKPNYFLNLDYFPDTDASANDATPPPPSHFECLTILLAGCSN